MLSFSLLVGEKSVWRAAATACAHPPGVVEVTRGISSTAEHRRRGLSTLGACDEGEVEKVKKPRMPVLFLREGVRECYYSMPPAGALTRPSSSDCSSSRSPSFPRSRGIKEEKRIAWFPWPPTTRRSIDN